MAISLASGLFVAFIRMDPLTNMARRNLLKATGFVGLCYSAHMFSPWIHPWNKEGLSIKRLVYSTKPIGESKLREDSFSQAEMQRQMRL
eukprot:g38932.t1